MDGEVEEQLKVVEDSIEQIGELFKDISNHDFDDLVKNLSPLDRAKYDLANLYTINSLFWMYIRSLGEDPNEHKITEELNRIKEQMGRVKEITETGQKSKMRIDKVAAARMIKHELWEAKKGNESKDTNQEDENWD